MLDERKLKSYVWHKDQCFFVSTIMRDSSAFVSPAPRYAETMAWEYNWDTQERGKQVGMTGDGPAFKQHFVMCEQLYKNGIFKEAGDE